VTPFWLETVVKHLGAAGEPQILIVSHHQEVVGVVSLACRDKIASFLGIADVCDYQDATIAPGYEEQVGRSVLDHLSRQGIQRLDLQTLRPQATMVKALESLEKKSRLNITRLPGDVTYEAALPGDWQSYLMQLSGKQRHEVRRKVRRLESCGTYTYRMTGAGDDLKEATEMFLKLFHLNRTDKAEFMDETMSAYFRELIERLARQQMLRLYFLAVDERPAAAVLCFDYNGTRYLYNSGYDADFQHLSVGIISKVLSIRKSIEAGCGIFDFLKGAEGYKKQIGGSEIPLYRYLVEF
jgi:CelD/BcsL family acetyltransferase involved in cellulose biosynthesis